MLITFKWFKNLNLIFFVFSIAANAKTTNCKVEACKYLDTLSIKNINLTSQVENALDKVQISFFEGETDSKEYIQFKLVTNLPVQKAKQQLKIRKEKLLSSYHPKETPYFASITKKIYCDKKIFPILQNENDHSIKYSLWANERKNYGVCDKKNAFYKSILLFKYCEKSNEFIELRFFVQKRMNMNNWIRSPLLQCL